MSGGDMRASGGGPEISISVGISVSVLENGRGSEELGGAYAFSFSCLCFYERQLSPLLGHFGLQP